MSLFRGSLSDFKEFRLRTKGCSQNRSGELQHGRFKLGSSGLRNSTGYQVVELPGKRRIHAHCAAFCLGTLPKTEKFDRAAGSCNGAASGPGCRRLTS